MRVLVHLVKRLHIFSTSYQVTSRCVFLNWVPTQHYHIFSDWSGVCFNQKLSRPGLICSHDDL